MGWEKGEKAPLRLRPAIWGARCGGGWGGGTGAGTASGAQGGGASGKAPAQVSLFLQSLSVASWVGESLALRVIHPGVLANKFVTYAAVVIFLFFLQSMASTESTVLLFYKYVNPPWSDEDASAMMSWQKEVGSRLRLSGRSRVANEGLNVNLSGTRANIEAYCAELLAWREGTLGKIDFKLAPTSVSQEFRGLKVWKTKEVVALGAYVNPDGDTGRHLAPSEFHQILSEAFEGKRPRGSVVLLDARNLYETRLGRFEVGEEPTGAETLSMSTSKSESGATVMTYAPPTTTFAELPAFIDEMPSAVGGSLANKTVTKK